MIDAFRRLVRAIVPEAPRLAVALARRRLRDRLAGHARRFARAGGDAPGPPLHRIVALTQAIRGTAFVEGKLANLRLGVERLDGVTIAPGEILSFWALVGRPDEAAGFQLGRSIRGGVTGGEIGGGLCQLSGIAYELGLRGGLDPIERHAHSHDLYTEEERFTPLGLDATVVWPYRDLRLANPLAVPVTLRFAVDGAALTAALDAPAPLPAAAIALDRRDVADGREVVVTRGAEQVSRDMYRPVARA